MKHDGWMSLTGTIVWPVLTAQYEMFAAYQLRTNRQIPLVRLRPVGTDEIVS